MHFRQSDWKKLVRGAIMYIIVAYSFVLLREDATLCVVLVFLRRKAESQVHTRTFLLDYLHC